MVAKSSKLSNVDNGGRRFGLDRRNYFYTLHVPERRSGRDRRAIADRRKTDRIKIEQLGKKNEPPRGKTRSIKV
jgi:hypothetical protein